MDNIYLLRIELEFLRTPILLSDSETKELFTSIDVIDRDEVVKELNEKIGDMYNGYYEFDTHDMPCWFNHEQEFKDRFIMRDLLQKLVDRLDELNDGSYIVEPIALEYYKKLCQQDKAEDKK